MGRFSDMFAELDKPIGEIAEDVTRAHPAALLGGAADKASKFVSEGIFGRDPGFSYEGVPAFALRAEMSRMDTPEEIEAILSQRVGPQGYTTSKYGDYALTPEGMAAMDLPPDETGLPTVIDRPAMMGPELGDIADIRGDIPGIFGSVAGGLAASGAGIPAAMAAAGLGGMLGKGIDEYADTVYGQNLQGPAEISQDLAEEAALGAVGEGVGRTVFDPIGRYLSAPHASRITPKAARMAREAAEADIPIKSTSITRAPLLSITDQVANRVWKDDKILEGGRLGLKREADRLRQSFGSNVPKEQLGTLIESDIRNSRKQLGLEARKWYGEVDDLVIKHTGNESAEVVPTSRLKEVAAQIQDDFVKTPEGEALFTSGEPGNAITSVIQDIGKLGDTVSLQDAATMRTTFSRLIDHYNITPGLSDRYGAMLSQAANKSIDDAADTGMLPKEVVTKLRDAQSKYREGIQKFDNATIKRITKDKALMGSMTPSMVVDFAVRAKDPTVVRRLKGVMDADTWSGVQEQTMEDILGKLASRPSDPLEEAIFDGRKLLTELDRIGMPTLREVFGAERAEDLFRLGRVAQGVEYKAHARGGELAAAAMAIRPLNNLGRILGLKAFSKYLSSGTGLKHFTTGLDIPKTRRGAAALNRLTTDFSTMADSDIQRQPLVIDVPGGVPDRDESGH